METPIADFVSAYLQSGVSRLHMPGHKGRGPLGCEQLDITEIAGADALYQADGIIARSERNAAALFGTAATFYSTEGSSQCIRAMLYLSMLHAPSGGERPVIVAARNAHQSFVLAAALLDVEIVWLWPEDACFSLCRCSVSSRQLEEVLKRLSHPPVAVYLTAPDYLGNTPDIAALAETAHRFGIPLVVDGAHGAYLKFLPHSAHPIDLGADLCCDSAHKTLPVLTGGAYLHVSSQAPADFIENGKRALALFGSTSPSYLILQSLDLANRHLAEDYPSRLAACAARLEGLRATLRDNGWSIAESDPMKLTIAAAESGWDGKELAELLRQGKVECEYADPDFTVLMATPENTVQDFTRILSALGRNSRQKPLLRRCTTLVPLETVCSPRKAAFAPSESVPASLAAGRILAAPTVGCPPAVPVAVGGERISQSAVEVFAYYGIASAEVIRER
ncbi:PLP-dependent transferase [uncultured Oscillibacter sp.]|uniref:PLP-dependent transferase n=1 Tax=uncultured Oscillibacter sp. TaxID=876091 RepID=UPI0025E2EFEF|nr:PLP-dependent transferase [uncultured Oscillibacter sp.]